MLGTVLTVAVDILNAAFVLLCRMGPWLTVGFLVAGIVGTRLPRAAVQRHLGATSGLGGILKAAAVGVPLPICSCGVIPVAASLVQSGAGIGPAIAFLAATPQTGIDSIAATYALLGPLYAILRPLAALAAGLLAGVLAALLPAARGRAGAAPAADAAAATVAAPAARPSVLRVAADILAQAFGTVFGRIAKPLAQGLLLSAILLVVLPGDFFAGFLAGHDLLAMLLMLGVGLPLYVCSMGALPIAVALMAKGLPPAAAFVFLVAGPAASAVTLTTVSSLFGRRATALYLLAISATALLSGALLAWLYGILPASFLPVLPVSSAASATDLPPPTALQLAAGLFLLALLAGHLLRPLFRKR